MVADASDIATVIKKGKKSEVKEGEVEEDEVEEESPKGKSKKSHAGAIENLVVGESNISEQIAGEDDTR